VVSNEQFFSGLKDKVSNLKFRATYGLVGNDQIGNDADRFFFLSQVNLNDQSRSAIFGERFGYIRQAFLLQGMVMITLPGKDQSR